MSTEPSNINKNSHRGNESQKLKLTNHKFKNTLKK